MKVGISGFSGTTLTVSLSEPMPDGSKLLVFKNINKEKADHILASISSADPEFNLKNAQKFLIEQEVADKMEKINNPKPVETKEVIKEVIKEVPITSEYKVFLLWTYRDNITDVTSDEWNDKKFVKEAKKKIDETIYDLNQGYYFIFAKNMNEAKKVCHFKPSFPDEILTKMDYLIPNPKYIKDDEINIF